ncbi:MAG: translocation/assembly module TamB domain-containing protein, partial [Deltaproteobacteria bacterium]|nr:translocation/assembly module TamB domain-containing protein [Deltaproteobacteria bacterium]
VVMAAALFLLGTYQIVFNSKYFQSLLLNTLNDRLKISLKWDELHFNGMTGHFSGENLDVFIPKTNTRIKLHRFRIAFSPFRLITKEIRLINLNAEKLYIGIGETTHAATGVKKRGSGANLGRLVDMFQIDRADLSEITLELAGGERLAIKQLKLNSQKPLLFYKKALSARAEEIAYHSPKADFFSKQLLVTGSYAMRHKEDHQKHVPEFDGKIITSAVLIGFNKTPSTSASPPWDASLDPIIARHYPEGIPENRAFAYIDSLNFPVFYDSERARIKDGTAAVFDGKLEVNLDYNILKGPIQFALGTKKDFKMSLLPLGKSKLRQSYERFTISLAGKGLFKTLKENDISGNLALKLLGNIFVPEAGDLSLSANPRLKDGQLDIPDLRIALAQGGVSARGNLDLIQKKTNISVKGNDFNAQTVIRFFSSTDIPGMADFDGSISGELKNPRFDLNLVSPGFGYESLYLGTFGGKLLIADRHLSLRGTSSLGGGSGTLDLQIDEVFKPSIQTVNLDTRFQGLPAAEALKTKALTGKISGTFGMKKSGIKYEGTGAITVSDILWYGVPIQQITGNLALDDKKLILAPITINWGTLGIPASRSTQPFVFVFSPEGYTFSGSPLPGLELDGGFANNDPTHLRGKITARNADFQFIKSRLPFDITRLTATGTAEVDYLLKAPADSHVTANFTALEMASADRAIRLEGGARLVYEKQKIIFAPTRLRVGHGIISLKGALGFEGGSNFSIQGDLDLDQMTGLIPPLAESSGSASVDLVMTGKAAEPDFSGKMNFKNATLLFRQLGRRFDELSGSVEWKGHRLTTSGLSGLYDDAPADAKGWVEWSPTGQIIAADLKFAGLDMPMSSPDTWRLLANMNVILRGAGGNLTLSGKMDVVEGLYYKDYVFSQFVLKPIGVTQEKVTLVPAAFKDFHLDLDVASSGEFEIRNNLADLILNGRLNLKGTVQDPTAAGTINVSEGNIHAVGIEFKDARGFVTFVPARKFTPYIEFTGSEDIQTYEIRVKLAGYTDNLNMTLESSPALSQNEIVSLIVYGRTPDQLVESQRNLFSSVAIASQLVGLIQRPLSKATKLDIVKLGAEYRPAEGVPVASRLSVGKQLSDRFSLAFTTDLSFQEAFQGITAEYLILDQLLLKTTKEAGPGFDFDLTWRFEAY